jgi:hypothetical protein
MFQINGRPIVCSFSLFLLCSTFVIATVIVAMGWGYVCVEQRLLTGPISIPEILRVNMERGAKMEWFLHGITLKDTEENLSQCHFVHYKAHRNCSGREPGPPRWLTAWAMTRPLFPILQQLSPNCTLQGHGRTIPPPPIPHGSKSPVQRC